MPTPRLARIIASAAAAIVLIGLLATPAVAEEVKVGASQATAEDSTENAVVVGLLRAQWPSGVPERQPVFIWRMYEDGPHWAGQGAITTSDGTYRIETPPGRITLSFGSDDLLWLGGRHTLRDATWIDVGPGEQTVPDVSEVRSAYAQGKVTSNGVDIPGALVALHMFSDDGTLIETDARRLTDERGSFLIEAPYEGSYRLTVTPPDGTAVWRQDATGNPTFSLSYPTPDLSIDLALALKAVVPSISGSTSVGSQLFANAGTWAPGTTLSYQWSIDGVPIPDAQSEALVVPPQAAGRVIRVTVTGSRPAYSPASATSAATRPIQQTSTPRITGQPVVGQTMSVALQRWVPVTSYAYQWLADGVAVPGARSSSLVVSPLLAGKRLTVQVSGVPSGYVSRVARTSDPTLRVASWTTPGIAGTVKVGYTLGVQPGRWTPGAVLRYQWYANGKAVSGATSSAVKLTPWARGKVISVTVTASKAGYPTVTKSSRLTAPIR